MGLIICAHPLRAGRFGQDQSSAPMPDVGCVLTVCSARMKSSVQAANHISEEDGMLSKVVRNQLLVFFAVAAVCSLSTMRATACDHGKTVQDARSGILKKEFQKANGHSVQGAEADQAESRPQNSPGFFANIVGLWDVKDYYQGQLIDEYFDTWNSDGNELFIDATDPIEDNVCQGIWAPAPFAGGQSTPSRTYKLKHVAWGFDDTGTLQYRAVFHDIITLSADGKSFTGTEDVYVYDLEGNLTSQYLGDVLQATRITIDF